MRHGALRGLVAITVLAIGAAGCGPIGGRPQVNVQRCRVVPDEVPATLASRMDERQGSFRHAFAVQSIDHGGVWIVSAELWRKSQAEEIPGDIYSFVTPSDPTVAAPGEYAALDPNAKEYSAWPPADLTVEIDGAVESRACVYQLRGPRGQTGILGGT